MNIDQQIIELEEKKLQLQEQKLNEELSLRLKDYNSKLKDKVLCRYIKANSSSQALYLTYYKEFYIGEDYDIKGNQIKSIQSKGEVITIGSNLYGRYECEFKTFKDSPMKGNADDLFPYYKIDKEKFIEVKLFQEIKRSIKSFSNNLFGFIDTELTPYYETTGSESDKIRKINNTHTLLDIPNIVLSKEETWLLTESVFLNGNVFLLTPNSINWLNEWERKEYEEDSFAKRACASVGERYRNSRYDDTIKLVSKIKKEYDQVQRRKSD